ncbi:MAG: hypothetical protein QF479_06810 [Candidatus Poseidoniaceae archaeon]|jgi:hypothetical protein|nr:hypothetical protein [Candidatus Poseidoniaceae archaeon]
MTNGNDDFWSQADAKEANIIQNITYNIQDSAISGDLNGSAKPDVTTQQAPPEQININQELSQPQYHNNQQGMPTQNSPSQQYYNNQQQAMPSQIHGQPSTIPISQGIAVGYYPQTSAVTAIVLAALSYVMCGIITAIPAVIVAKGALEITDQNPNHPDAGTAKAAFILGWINIGLFAVGLFFWMIIIVLSVAFGGV